MEQMQFTAVILLTLLMLKLLLLPHKVLTNPVVSTARWLMTIGIAILDLQFLLQYTLGLRAMGVTQAVLFNLVMFVPSSWTISLAIIKLQQRKISRVDKMVGGIVWAMVLLILGTAVVAGGQPLLTETSELHFAEVLCSILYLALQGHYAYRVTANLRGMRLTLQNYYDRDMDGMLLWMKYSIIVLMVLAMMVPMLIFVQRKELAVFAIIFFIGIFYMVDTFCHYVISSSSTKMMKAEQEEMNILPAADNDTEEESLVPTETPASNTDDTFDSDSLIDNAAYSRVEHAVELWVSKGGYRQCGLNIPKAADEMGIPRYLLSAWLRQHGYTYATWMNDLRIEEAKRVIKEHPDWNNEAVASHCGFSDRTYFQKKFKDKTGLSPTEFVRNSE